MINKYRPHVLLLPEDDANSQIANGFVLELDQSALTRIQVLPEAGGWRAVLDTFQADHVPKMGRYTERHMVLLIDFDGQEGRLNEAKSRVPQHLSNRVFILGVWTEPEGLKADIGPYESIGGALARDCATGTYATWSRSLLRHNASEIDRLRLHIRPILF